MRSPGPPLPTLRGRRPASGVHRLGRLFDGAARTATRAAGTAYAFALALLVVIGWALSGPLFAYSESWQLVINTGTTIVTFLMVFVIQHAANKDSVALHLKLNELLAAVREASNGMIAVEDLDEDELQLVRQFYSRLAQLDRAAGGVSHSHSSDRVVHAHARKRRHSRTPAPSPHDRIPESVHDQRSRPHGGAQDQRTTTANPARR